MRWPLLVGLAGVIASVVAFWFAPLLGAILMIGTVSGVLVSVGPAAIDVIARMLSGAPPRRRR